MFKLIIADDEPLVQIGLRSMTDWSALDVEICGTASNGDAAWALIKEHRPDIVITDIQMPCSSGLELGRRCMDELGELPVFIILTSFEDFQYAREALSFRAVDYLVKIDLTPDTLTAAVKKAIEQVKTIRRQHPEARDTRQSLLMFQERFYIRLLNNLFESREQFLHQQKEFKVETDAWGYAAALFRFSQGNADPPDNAADLPMQTYGQVFGMFQELLSKYISCHVIALDTHFLAAVFFLDEGRKEDWKDQIRQSLNSTSEMLYNYYSISLFACVGGLVHDPMELSSSYSDSRQILPYLDKSHPILFCDDMPDRRSLRNVFSMSLFRDDIVHAFQELDADSLRTIIDTIRGLLGKDHIRFSQALDAAANILHFSMTLLSDGPEIVSGIFQDEPDNYRSLYHLKSTPAVTAWLLHLEDGLCAAFEEKKKSHQNSVVSLCCQYIQEHIHERIFLQDIADTFGISPNYLSQLFKKNMDVGISEYITARKIDESKKLLRETNLKIYEISDQLGFESSFYFSKVFKKITGLSPKDFRNRP